MLVTGLEKKGEVTKDFYSVTYLGIKLKGWQAHAIAWLKEMEGMVASSILSDDVGLGKTVVEFCNLCRAQNEQEARHHQWEERMREAIDEYRLNEGILPYIERPLVQRLDDLLGLWVLRR